jgi:hypothetical protein
LAPRTDSAYAEQRRTVEADGGQVLQAAHLASALTTPRAISTAPLWAVPSGIFVEFRKSDGLV